MRKIAYLTGTRAEFGLMENILSALDKNPDWQLQLLVTGMHLMEEFGHTISEVDKKFKVAGVIEAIFAKDDRESMARFVAKCLTGLTEKLTELKPDVVLVLGDRGEQLSMATAAAYHNIPVVHLHGGETTTTVDDKARNAISEFADWHLPATQKAAEKLIQMGIDKKQIQVVGAPGLDEITKFNLSGQKDSIVVLQHPDENENEAAKQMRQTLEVALGFNLPVVTIYPNADAGGRSMIKVINEYKNRVKIFPSIGRSEFLQLLTKARVLIGNSSAALIEAPALKLPAVNIGPRQLGRERGNNVIDSGYEQKQIKIMVAEALKMKLSKVVNPYGDGKTTQRVIKFLNSL